MKIQTPINKRITRGASGVVGCPHHPPMWEKLDSVELGVEGFPHALTHLYLPVATHHSIGNNHFQTIKYH